MWVVVQYLCVVGILAFVLYLSVKDIWLGIRAGMPSWGYMGLAIISGIGMWYMLHHTPFLITPV
jgi:hypothetical protein